MKASEREILWVMRVGIFFVAALATVMGITINSVYGLWFLCADLVYVVLFPQLCCVVYVKHSNTYGSFAAYWVGLLLRLIGGEPLIGLPALLKYPFYDYNEKKQLFPFRTFAMLASFMVTLLVSYVTKFLFENELLRKEFDLFKCVTNIPQEAIALNESITIDELSKLNVNQVNTGSSMIAFNANKKYDEMSEERKRKLSYDSHIKNSNNMTTKLNLPTAYSNEIMRDKNITDD